MSALVLSAAVIAAAIAFNSWSNLRMSKSLDDLTTSIGRLEQLGANAVTALTAGAGTPTPPDDADLDALKGRVDAVSDALAAAIAPPVQTA